MDRYILLMPWLIECQTKHEIVARTRDKTMGDDYILM